MHIDIRKLWDYTNLSQTRETFLVLLEKTKACGGKLDAILELETQVARTCVLQSEFSEAHEILDRVETRLTKKTKIAQARYFLGRGGVLNYEGDTVAANTLFIEAYAAAQRCSDDDMVLDAIRCAANTAASFEQKLKWTKKGIAVTKGSEEPIMLGWLVLFYENISWDLITEERYEEALEVLKACRDIYSAQKAEHDRSTAEKRIAKTYRLMGRGEEALELQLQFLDDWGGEDSTGYIYEELGELYLEKGESEKGKFYSELAYEILSQDKWLLENEGLRLDRLLELSK